MGLFDVHAHLTHPRFDGERDAVIARAREAGLTTIISNGLNPADNAAVLELARREPIVKPALGLYPVDAVLCEMRAAGVDYPREGPEQPAEDAIAYVRAHVREAIAVGEIGLDGHWVPEQFWARQEDAFVQLVQIAIEANKPIIIHTRKREQHAFDLLRELGATRVDWHCFGGRVKLARKIAEHGHFLSIPANARRSESFTRMLETLPRERVLLETDCPYLGPDPGARNEPANVSGTLAYAAEVWAMRDVDEAQQQLERNFSELFGQAP